MLFTVTIPQKPPNYSVQGLRQLHEQAKGKRPPQFTIEFDAKKPRDLTAFYASLEQQLLKAVSQLFVQEYQQWLKEFSEPLVRVRQLFLNDRDNLELWGKILEIVQEWAYNLANELKANFDLGVYIQVQLNLRQKCQQLENALYWFNPLLGQSVESKCLEAVDSMNKPLEHATNMALVSLYKQPTFSEYFMPLHTMLSSQFLPSFLDLLSLNEWACLPHQLGDFVVAFGNWKAEQKLQWLKITGNHEAATSLARQLESRLLRVALDNCCLESAILESPAALWDMERYLGYHDDLLRLWNKECRRALSVVYSRIQPLAKKPKAAMLVNIMATKNPHFNWVQIFNDDPEAAAALALLVAQDMEAQNYARIKVVAALVEAMDENRPYEYDMGQFLEIFGEQLWHQLAPRVVVCSDIKRFVHGLQLFDTICPDVLMNVNVLVGIVERDINNSVLIVPAGYWPCPEPWDGTGAPVEVPALQSTRRFYSLDKHSQCATGASGAERRSFLSLQTQSS